MTRSHIGLARVTLRCKDGLLIGQVTIPDVQKAIDAHLFGTSSGEIQENFRGLAEKIVNQSSKQLSSSGYGIGRFLPCIPAIKPLLRDKSFRLAFVVTATIAGLYGIASIARQAIDENTIKNMVLETLKDPSSAKFKRISVRQNVELVIYPPGTFSDPDTAVEKMDTAVREGKTSETTGTRGCVIVNAKNSFGGYVGDKAILFTKDAGKDWEISDYDGSENFSQEEWCDLHLN